MNGSLLPRRVDRQLRSLEGVTASDRDPIAALRESVEAIWKVVERATSEPALDASRDDGRVLLARRELMQRSTRRLSAVIRGGVESGAFRPGCASWAMRQLPFAIVAGACARWVFGLATAPSLRASVAIEAALDVLRPRSHRLISGRRPRNAGTRRSERDPVSRAPRRREPVPAGGRRQRDQATSALAPSPFVLDILPQPLRGPGAPL